MRLEAGESAHYSHMLSLTILLGKARRMVFQYCLLLMFVEALAFDLGAIQYLIDLAL